MKQFPIIFNNENLEFIKGCCLLGLNIYLLFIDHTQNGT